MDEQLINMGSEVVENTVEATAQAFNVVQQLLQALVNFAVSFGGKLLGCVLVLIIGLRVIKWISKKVQTAKALDKMDSNLRSFLGNGLNLALDALLAIICCGILGIDTTSLITVLASCGVAVGLAMQGALSNVAGGLMIMLFKPFHVGDFVEVAGISGTVRSVTVFYTFLDTPDNKQIMVPNGGITSANVINYSVNGKRRVDVDFSVGYDSDIEKVKTLIAETAAAHPLVMKDPEIFCRMTKQDDSALVFTLRVWAKTGDYWTVYFDLMEETKRVFDANGINIPYPQMDVHVMQG